MIDWLIDIIEYGITLLIKLASYLWDGIFSTSLNVIDSIMPKLISFCILVIILVFLNDILFDD